jgi:hypothetical protein
LAFSVSSLFQNQGFCLFLLGLVFLFLDFVAMAVDKMFMFVPDARRNAEKLNYVKNNDGVKGNPNNPLGLASPLIRHEQIHGFPRNFQIWKFSRF